MHHAALCRLWLPVVIVVPLAIALLLNSASIRGAATFGSCSSFHTSCPLWRVSSSGRRCWVKRVGSTEPWVSSESTTPELAPRHQLDLSGLGDHRPVGHRGRHRRQHRWLQGIPTELYDAAKIDGAGWWAQLRHVTLPMMSPVIFYTLTLGVVEVMQYFLVPLVINNGTGEPGGSTLFYNLYLYKTFFTFSRWATEQPWHGCCFLSS